MKTEELKGLGLSNEQIRSVMALHGADVEHHKQQISELSSALGTAREQLIEANTKLEGLNSEWNVKVQQIQKQEQQKAIDQIASIERNSAAEFVASGLAFSSKAARRIFVRELNASELKLHDGEFLGIDEFVQNFKNKDPEAFLHVGSDGSYPNIKDSGDSFRVSDNDTSYQLATILGSAL